MAACNTETATETSLSSVSGGGVISSSISLTTTFKEHFEDRKSVAAAYLLAIGAKALFYVEREVEVLETKRSFREEAAIHMSMKIDEISATFFSKISSKQGMKVKKRGRNGRIRKMTIHLETNEADLQYVPETKSFFSNSWSLVYKSCWSRTKKFDLGNISMLTLESNPGSESASVFENMSIRGNDSRKVKSPHGVNLQTVGDCDGATYDDGMFMNENSFYSVDSDKIVSKRGSQVGKKGSKHESVSAPYIRITNADRYIDLQFETLTDHQGCLESFQKFCQNRVTQRGGSGGLVVDDHSHSI